MGRGKERPGLRTNLETREDPHRQAILEPLWRRVAQPLALAVSFLKVFSEQEESRGRSSLLLSYYYIPKTLAETSPRTDSIVALIRLFRLCAGVAALFSV